MVKIWKIDNTFSGRSPDATNLPDSRGPVWNRSPLLGDGQCCKLFVFRGDRHMEIYASPDNWRTCVFCIFWVKSKLFHINISSAIFKSISYLIHCQKLFYNSVDVTAIVMRGYTPVQLTGDVTFSWFLLFSTCYSLHIAVSVFVNCSFYILFYVCQMSRVASERQWVRHQALLTEYYTSNSRPANWLRIRRKSPGLLHVTYLSWLCLHKHL